MHDAIIGERLGIPSVGVMTTEFVSAAELMAKVLGAEGHPFSVIQHPISSASANGLADRARKSANDIAGILLGKVTIQ